MWSQWCPKWRGSTVDNLGIGSCLTSVELSFGNLNDQLHAFKTISKKPHQSFLLHCIYMYMTLLTVYISIALPPPVGMCPWVESL